MNAAQNRAVANHRRRLGERGLARYEVRGLAQDKNLIRAFAKRLAADDASAGRLRREIAREIALEGPLEPRTGKYIVEALRRSPLVGSGVKFEREFTTGRDIGF